MKGRPLILIYKVTAQTKTEYSSAHRIAYTRTIQSTQQAITYRIHHAMNSTWKDTRKLKVTQNRLVQLRKELNDVKVNHIQDTLSHVFDNLLLSKVIRETKLLFHVGSISLISCRILVCLHVCRKVLYFHRQGDVLLSVLTCDVSVGQSFHVDVPAVGRIRIN